MQFEREISFPKSSPGDLELRCKGEACGALGNLIVLLTCFFYIAAPFFHKGEVGSTPLNPIHPAPEIQFAVAR